MNTPSPIRYALLFSVVACGVSAVFGLSQFLFEEDVVADVCALCDQPLEEFCTSYFNSPYDQKVWQLGSDEVRAQYLNQCRSKLSYCTFSCETLTAMGRPHIEYNQLNQSISIGKKDVLGMCPFIRARRNTSGRWELDDTGCASE